MIRVLFAALVATLLCGQASAQLPPISGGGAAAGPGGAACSTANLAACPSYNTAGRPIGPVDILAAAGTPAAAAHSVTRCLSYKYTGAIFQAQRLSDSATVEIGCTASGEWDSTTFWAFCTTVCNYSIIYDQVNTPALGNNLPQATASLQSVFALSYKNGLPVVYSVMPENNSLKTYYRNRVSTVHMPVGNVPLTLYYVRDDVPNPSAGAGDYGLMESTVADTGAGAMFALGYSTYNCSGIVVCNGPLGYAVDLEQGLIGRPLLTRPAVFNLLAKYSSATGKMAIKAGDATSGILTLLYDAPPYATVNLQGGLSLGEGGDGSYSPSAFREGVIAPSYTTPATDAALQSNITSFYNIAPAPYVGPGDVVPAASWTTWGGLRAFSQMTRGTAAVNVCNVSDATCVDMVTDKVTGFLVVTTVGGSNCASVACTIKTVYDQTGHSRDWTQATIANRPALTLNCTITGHYGAVSAPVCMTWPGTSGQRLVATVPTGGQPVSYYAVAQRTGAPTTAQSVVATSSSASVGSNLSFYNATNSAQIYCGGTGRPSFQGNGVMHAMIAICNGATSVAFLDQVYTPQPLVGSQGGNTSVAMGNNVAVEQPLNGLMMEGGMSYTAFTFQQLIGLDRAAHVAWGI